MEFWTIQPFVQASGSKWFKALRRLLSPWSWIAGSLAGEWPFRSLKLQIEALQKKQQITLYCLPSLDIGPPFMALAVHSTWLEIKLVLESVKVCGGWCATIWTLVVGVALFHAPHYIQFFNTSLSCSSLKWPQHGGPTPTRTTCTTNN